MNKTCLITAFLICSPLFFLYAQEAEWTLKKSKEGIDIHYRWVGTGQDRVRQLRTSMRLDCEVDDVVEMIRNDSASLRWVNRMVQFKNFDESENGSWYTYSEIDIPWPFQNRDLITRNQLKKTEKGAVITLLSAPDKLPDVEGLVRIETFSGEWIIDKTSVGKTQIDYLVMTEGPPLLPAWFTDPIVENGLIKTMQALAAELAR
ncbi:MAG: hypothetical protein JJU28_01605 [Cyclobacteriaceae bacterium]|nr:hypothetical protein [Cyclobacteriaceae bacterium]